MTDEELDRLDKKIAEWLGLTYNKSGFEQYDPSYWKDPQGKFVGRVFSPTRSWGSVGVLMEALGKRKASPQLMITSSGGCGCILGSMVYTAGTVPLAISKAVNEYFGLSLPTGENT